MSVWDQVPGQPRAVALLRQASERPHHAYLFAGPEGSGKTQAMRAFVAALLCADGGCGDCRDCRLAADDRHPNMAVVEPEGRDIHADTVREQIWTPAHRTSVEQGYKVFVVREADRLNPSAADIMLKVLEEPPAGTVLLLASARPNDVPETVLSRCHTITILPLTEAFVVQALEDAGINHADALLATRLAGGHVGRARRLASDANGFISRDTAAEALGLALQGTTGALAAADAVMKASADYKKTRKSELEHELGAFQGEDGTAAGYTGMVRRIEARHHRMERRAERDFIDWTLLAMSAMLRDDVLLAVGGDPAWRINLDLEREPHVTAVTAARGIGAIESARAALAEELNLNAKLVLEQAFLDLARTLAA